MYIANASPTMSIGVARATAVATLPRCVSINVASIVGSGPPRPPFDRPMSTAAAASVV